MSLRFLGVSYCASLLATRKPLSQVIWVVLLPPACLLLGALVAGLVGGLIEGTEYFTGFISLAIVALFFLVTQVGVVAAPSQCSAGHLRPLRQNLNVR